MALQKSNIPINFSMGVDTKTDPYQIDLGKFLDLQNTIFLKGKRLTKRNGYKALPSLPNTTSTFLTTFNTDLTAIGTQLEAYSPGTSSWVNQGAIQPVGLSVLTLIRNNTNQSQADNTIAANGLTCTVYTDQTPTSLSTPEYKYAIADSTTGQNIVEPTVIVGADATYGAPRVFLLGGYFIVMYTILVSASYHLVYQAISTNNPTTIFGPTTISSSYTPATTQAFDAAVFNNALYIAWNGAASSGINMTLLSSALALSGIKNVDAAHTATMVSVSPDSVNDVVWVSYYSSGSSNGYSLAVNTALNTVVTPKQVITALTVLNITSSAQSGVNTVIYEVSNNYTYDSSIPTHFINLVTVTQTGTVGVTSTILRSVGLASKSFIFNNTIYFLTTYSSSLQPTYFLSNAAGQLVAKLAYENGGGYLTQGLPSVSVIGNYISIPYLFKDLIAAVNTNTNIPSGTQVGPIYSQTGINLATFQLAGADIITAEIGTNLNLTGGFLWAYDGYSVTEQGFHVFPDNVEVTTSPSGGALAAQEYFYQVTYEWTDNQGNAFRSAPSVPVAVTSTGSTSSNTINVPTLRLTYKTANPVKIVIYRWSTAQQEYYQVTSITAPILNSLTVDSIAYVDTLSDAQILGNNLIYTTGGVVEDVGGPSFKSVFLFDDRLWGITAEDPNLLWYSKQVIESTPVEMSDLFTVYVAPSIGAQGSTGPMICGSALDDKLCLFKASAISYINGSGPDNTGANSQYSQPIFITSTVGCSNQKSITVQPQGLMFEFASEAGNQIWLLGRDLSTQYIGAPVENYTQNATVQSAVNIPGTNQVRFTLSTGITLMYDYYYSQWGTFTNVPATSSTLYQGLHTYINSFGQVFQESPGAYLDGSSPVCMAFQTSWINLTGLQGFQRAYELYLLGTYYSPHKLNVQIAYDYNNSPSQNDLITPNNYSGTWGSDPNWGGGPNWGGVASLEQWRVFFQQQKCQSFSILIQEVFDASFNTVPGQGLTLSGLNLTVGAKGSRPKLRAAVQVG